MANEGTIKLGPWGGPGGVAWDFNPGIGSSIIEIEISSGDIVDSVTFKSFNKVTGKTTASGKHGGKGGVLHKISIDGSREYLTLISGTTCNYDGNVIIGSLTFHTNLTHYGPFGLTTGSAFKIPMENGETIGFFGRAGDSVDTLGIYVTPSVK